MRKYFQITVVLGAFFLLVLARQFRGSDEDQSRSISAPTKQTSQPSSTPAAQTSSNKYADGTYDGSVEDAYYGYIQVQAVITGGKISDVVFLQYPSDNRTSRSINEQAMPILKSEAIQAQSASVDIVSGASDSSTAFQKSLQTALQKSS